MQARSPVRGAPVTGAPAPGTPVTSASAGRGCRRAMAAIAVAAVAIFAAGCGTSAKPSGTGHHPAAGQSAVVTRCGTTRTAANVPVDIEVERGQVPCTTALTVERGYARAIRAGRAPGAGGNGPVSVQGWTCQSFPTPEVLKTGQASKCISGATEILAILPAPA